METRRDDSADIGKQHRPATLVRLAGVLLIGICGSLAVLAGCEDPSKGKSKAVTTEARSSELSPSAVEGKPSGSTVRYDLDAARSKVQWTGSKVTGKHEGGFSRFRGEISVADGLLEKGSVKVEIDTDSLFADSEKLVGHLKSPDFFDVGRFPKATFASTAVKAGGDHGASHTVTGNLTLHGVTKAITFPATVRSSAGGIEVDSEFVIDRKDFGLVYAGKPDDLIRDQVVIKLTIRSERKS